MLVWNIFATSAIRIITWEHERMKRCGISVNRHDTHHVALFTVQKASLLNAAQWNDLRPFNLKCEFCSISQGVVIQHAILHPSMTFSCRLSRFRHKGWNKAEIPRSTSSAILHRIATTIASITGDGTSIPLPYRLHLNLECREFSHSLSLSFPFFSLSLREHAACP